MAKAKLLKLHILCIPLYLDQWKCTPALWGTSLEMVLENTASFLGQVSRKLKNHQILFILFVIWFNTVGIFYFGLRLLRKFGSVYLLSRNDTRRRILLAQLQIYEHSAATHRTVVGFFHPYWRVVFDGLLCTMA